MDEVNAAAVKEQKKKKGRRKRKGVLSLMSVAINI